MGTQGGLEMSKIPYVDRGYGNYGLTGECAFLWALFLMNEADMADDNIAYDKWKACAETLQPREGKPTPAVVHYAALEEEIAKYIDKE
jgi:hypothetical protein